MFEVNNKTAVNKPVLEGFKIHDVEFKGVEKAEYKNGEFKVIVIKFENENGYFRDTIFEPKASDSKRTQSQFGENPANTELISEKFKMLIEAVNPELAKQIADGSKTLQVRTWEQMRDLFVKATEKFIGVKTQIKLDKNTKGEASFPGYFLGISKEGNLFRKSTFIGNNLAFTAKEITRQANFVASKPTNMAKKNDGISLDLGESNDSDLNLKGDDFGLGDL